MSYTSNNISANNICQYCHSGIKVNTEIYYCPECNSSYHKECWDENEGCAVYGCESRAKHGNLNSLQGTVHDSVINAEYLINKRKYIEAINECSKVLNIDEVNVKAKELYNYAVSLVNAKMRLSEDGDLAYDRKDFISAGIFYRNLLKYTDDIESDVIKAKLDAIEKTIPSLRRKRIFTRVLLSSIVFLIFASILYIGYYYVFLTEVREFKDIEKVDDITNKTLIEKQISKYEKFIRKYPDGNYNRNAKDKINYLSAVLAEKIYRDDWRAAMKLLKKTDNDDSPQTFKDLYESIFERAQTEFNKNLESAGKNNDKKIFSESKSDLESALDIIGYFPESKLNKEKFKLDKSLALVNRKISLLPKYNDIEREIEEKLKELKSISKGSDDGREYIDAQVTGFKGKSFLIAKLLYGQDIVAIKSTEKDYRKGDFIAFECFKKGNVTFLDEKGEEKTLPLYVPVAINDEKRSYFESFGERESIVQRLNYLKIQKNQMDSLFITGLSIK